MGDIKKFETLCLDYGYEISSVDELVKSGDDALGKKVYIETHSRNYTGVISYIFSKSKRIWIEDAVITNANTPVFSLLTLFFSDVLRIATCGVDLHIRKRIFEELYDGEESKQWVAKPVLPYSIAKEESTGATFEIDPCVNHHPAPEYHAEALPSEPLPFPYARMLRPSRWTIIDDLESFKEAISEIKKEATVGVSAQDKSVGRTESLVWLAVATSRNVFLIDMVAIGIEDALRAGLRDVMMDACITKIISGAEKLEDYFYHQHNLQMDKVSIPEVQDLYLSIKEGKGMPSLYKDFKVLLSQNLGIKKHHIPHLYEHIAHDLEWHTRPLPEPLCCYLFESVVLLRELHQSLLDCILLPLSELFKMQLASLKGRDALGAERFNEVVVPSSIQEAKTYIQEFLPLVSKFGYGRRTE